MRWYKGPFTEPGGLSITCPCQYIFPHSIALPHESTNGTRVHCSMPHLGRAPRHMQGRPLAVAWGDHVPRQRIQALLNVLVILPRSNFVITLNAQVTKTRASGTSKALAISESCTVAASKLNPMQMLEQATHMPAGTPRPGHSHHAYGSCPPFVSKQQADLIEHACGFRNWPSDAAGGQQPLEADALA